MSNKHTHTHTNVLNNIRLWYYFFGGGRNVPCKFTFRFRQTDENICQVQYSRGQDALRLLQSDSPPTQGASHAIHHTKRAGSLSDCTSTLGGSELADVCRYLLNSAARSVRRRLHGTAAHFCAYMPNVRLATRDAEDHASAKSSRSPSTAPPPHTRTRTRTHMHMHAHTHKHTHMHAHAQGCVGSPGLMYLRRHLIALEVT